MSVPPPGWMPGPASPYVSGLMPRMRVERNLQPLGILWCIYGAYRLLSIAFAGFVLHTLARNGLFGGMPSFVAESVRSFIPMIVCLTVLTSGAAMLTGYALLTRKPWARVLAIILGILALIKPITGTALGIYTLWVLAPQVSGAEWDAMTGAQSMRAT